MNKKIIITMLIVVAVIALLPLIGNKGMSETIDSRIAILELNGLSVDKESKSSYMNTQTSYVLGVEDAQKFVKYLGTLSKSQVPPYVAALVDDTKVGVDVSYSNIPVLSDISVDIFPIALSKEINADILADDPVFHKQLTKILDDQMLVYHIDYSVSGMSFKGHIKDIDEKLDFKDGSNAHLVLVGSKFKGKGTLMEPSQIESNIKTIKINAVDAAGAVVKVKIENLNTANIFESVTNYKLALMIDDFEIDLKQAQRKAKVEFDGLSFTYLSEIKDAYMSLKSTMQLHELEMDNEGEKFSAKNVDYDMALNKLNKDDAKKIQELASQLQYAPTGQATLLMSEAILVLLEKGLEFDLNKFSVDEFTLADTKTLKGFDHDLHIVLNADPKLKEKLANPMALMNNIDLSSKLSFQEKLYEFLKAQSPQGAMLDNFAKKDGNNIVFDIVVKDQQLTVNGKKL